MRVCNLGLTAEGSSPWVFGFKVEDVLVFLTSGLGQLNLILVLAHCWRKDALQVEATIRRNSASFCGVPMCT